MYPIPHSAKTTVRAATMVIQQNVRCESFHPMRACNTSAYKSQLINDQSSIGSHAQYLPQAACAQMEPDTIITPHSIKPNIRKFRIERGNELKVGILEPIFPMLS